MARKQRLTTLDWQQPADATLRAQARRQMRNAESILLAALAQQESDLQLPETVLAQLHPTARRNIEAARLHGQGLIGQEGPATKRRATRSPRIAR